MLQERFTIICQYVKKGFIWEIPQILLKVRHSEGFSQKNLFCLDASLTLSMTLFWKFLAEFAV